MTAQTAAGLSYLEEEARRADKDRFLCTLFAPPERREALCALLVVNQEIARIPELVEDTLLRRIRLQWWRDELLGIAKGRASEHPALSRLAPAIRAAAVPEAVLDRYLDAREGELEFEQPADLAVLEGFGEATSGAMGETFARLLGETSPKALEAARCMGTAWALIGLARSLPHHARMGRCYLPLDLCRRHGVAPEELFAGRRPAGLGHAVEAVVLRACALLRDLRAMRKEVSRRAIPALLPAVLADGYARTLRRRGFDPFAASVASPSTLDLIRLGLSARFGRY